MAVWAAVAATAVSAYSAKQQGDAAKSAARTQAEAAEAAGNLAHAEFLTAREDLAPWRIAGEQSLYMLQDIYGVPREIKSQAAQQATQAPPPPSPADVGLLATEWDPRETYGVMPPERQAAAERVQTALQTPPTTQEVAPPEMTPRGTFETSPGYLFRQQQGMEAIQKSAASRGLLRSGGTLEAIQEFGQGLASEEYNNYTNSLRSMAQVGQVATQNTAALGSAAARTQGQALMAGGAARGSGYLGQAQATQQFAGQVQQGLGLYAGMQYQQQPPATAAPVYTNTAGQGGVGAGSSLGLL